MKVNELEIDVRFSDIDSMKIAHNSKYYIWFEIGRFDFSKNVLNLDANDIFNDLRLPVVKSNCKYLYGIHLGDKLSVTTYMYLNDTSKICFYYTIENQEKKLCAVGSTQHVLINQDGKCTLKFLDNLQEIFASANNKYPNCFLTEDKRVQMDNRINR